MSDATQPGEEARNPLRLGLTLLVYALAVGLGLRMLQLGWRRWADVLVDFGRELYVPWRLAEGDTLYSDVAYFNGPLSPWINSNLFRATGASYEALFSLNLVLFVVFVVLFARYLTRISSGLSAALAIAFLVPSLGLAQLAGIANYNWLSPYSHELTHGIMLSMLALAAAGRATRNPSSARAWSPARAWLIITGLLLGLVFLTKPETMLAASAGVFATLKLSLFHRRAAMKQALREVGLVLLVALLPFLGAVLWASPALGFGQALVANLGSWVGIFASETTDLPFYKYGMGTDAPGANVRILALSALIVAAFLTPALLWSRFAPMRLRTRGKDALAAAIYFGALFGIWHFSDLRALRLARPLPLLTGLFAIWTSYRAWRSGGIWIERAGFAWLGCLLLMKMVLRARFEHYGFALTFPGLAVLVVGASAWLQPTRASLVPAAAVAALLLGAGLELWQTSTRMYANKTHSVASGGDQFFADPRGLYVNACLQAVEESFGPDDTLLVLPEGITLNYLARRKSPTQFINFMPPELLLYGEDTIIAALAANPPTGVVLVHKDTSEYGFPLFGRNYGQQIMSWLGQQKYQPFWLEGDRPLQPGSMFGIALLRKTGRKTGR